MARPGHRRRPVAVLYLTGVLSEVVIPILVAMLLAALLQPIYNGLTRIMPRGARRRHHGVGTLAMVFGMLSFVGTQLTSQITDIGTKVTDGIDQIRQWLNTTFGITDTQLEGYVGKRRGGEAGQPHRHRGLRRLTATHIVAASSSRRSPCTSSSTTARWCGAGWCACSRRRLARRCTPPASSPGPSCRRSRGATLVVAAVDAAGIGIGAAILGVPFASGIALLVFFGAFIPVVGAAVSGRSPCCSPWWPSGRSRR